MDIVLPISKLAFPTAIASSFLAHLRHNVKQTTTEIKHPQRTQLIILAIFSQGIVTLSDVSNILE